MDYKLYSLVQFGENHFDSFKRAKKEIYPDEPEPRKEDLLPFKENSFVLSAEEGGEVKGFSAFCICRSSRDGRYFGSNLYFYVEPEKRKSSVSGRLIKMTEDFCKSIDCYEFKWDVLVDSSLVQALEKRSQYKKESIIFSKKLV